ncbi:MAG: DUF1329 domain-containing protein [Rhodocyclaceae bacterium]|nr:DUF1329 domain-containing protein [Rhodocyclaceae bacterium]
MKKTIVGAMVAAGFSLCSASVLAAVSAEEAKQLGSTLTEFGAEKAGNKDGSIPAYTGGLEKLPAYDPTKMKAYLDPFANEKPQYSIDAKNMAQYDALLTDGTKYLVKNYPGYRVDVYPTHRTMRYPSWVLQNSVKNATTAKLGGPVEGDNLEGADNGMAYAGVPFPIPKTGYEVMWNHTMRYSAAVTNRKSQAWLVDTSGAVSNLPSNDQWFVHPQYDRSGKLKALVGKDVIFGYNALLTDPPSSAGIVFLNFYTNQGAAQRVWFYTPGQRRVRMAPEFAYDVPIASYGGVFNWDDLFGFQGRLDRYDIKIVGKKEMIVPYNVFKVTNTAPTSAYLTKKFVNPDLVRWEKHRVWVVEWKLKAGARHVYPRRVFYVDEDSWYIVASDHYDAAGNLYRTKLEHTFPTYDVGGLNLDGWATYDVIKGNYTLINSGLSDPRYSIRCYDSAEGLQLNLTAQSVAASGVR